VSGASADGIDVSLDAFLVHALHRLAPAHLPRARRVLALRVLEEGWSTTGCKKLFVKFEKLYLFGRGKE